MMENETVASPREIIRDLLSVISTNEISENFDDTDSEETPKPQRRTGNRRRRSSVNASVMRRNSLMMLENIILQNMTDVTFFCRDSNVTPRQVIRNALEILSVCETPTEWKSHVEAHSPEGQVTQHLLHALTQQPEAFLPHLQGVKADASENFENADRSDAEMDGVEDSNVEHTSSVQKTVNSIAKGRTRRSNGTVQNSSAMNSYHDETLKQVPLTRRRSLGLNPHSANNKNDNPLTPILTSDHKRSLLEDSKEKPAKKARNTTDSARSGQTSNKNSAKKQQSLNVEFSESELSQSSVHAKAKSSSQFTPKSTTDSPYPSILKKSTTEMITPKLKTLSRHGKKTRLVTPKSGVTSLVENNFDLCNVEKISPFSLSNQKTPVSARMKAITEGVPRTSSGKNAKTYSSSKGILREKSTPKQISSMQNRILRSATKSQPHPSIEGIMDDEEFSPSTLNSLTKSVKKKTTGTPRNNFVNDYSCSDADVPNKSVVQFSNPLVNLKHLSSPQNFFNASSSKGSNSHLKTKNKRKDRIEFNQSVKISPCVNLETFEYETIGKASSNSSNQQRGFHLNEREISQSPDPSEDSSLSNEEEDIIDSDNNSFSLDDLKMPELPSVLPPFGDSMELSDSDLSEADDPLQEEIPVKNRRRRSNSYRRRRKVDDFNRDDIFSLKELQCIVRRFYPHAVSKDALKAIQECSNEFLMKLKEILLKSNSASKRTTISLGDIELLLRNQNLISENIPLEVHIENFLPLELRRELIPIATSGNIILPPMNRKR